MGEGYKRKAAAAAAAFISRIRRPHCDEQQSIDQSINQSITTSPHPSSGQPTTLSLPSGAFSTAAVQIWVPPPREQRLDGLMAHDKQRSIRLTRCCSHGLIVLIEQSRSLVILIVYSLTFSFELFNFLHVFLQSHVVDANRDLGEVQVGRR